MRARALELGCQPPNGLTILPRNFADAEAREQLEHEATGLSVRSALRAAEIEESRLEPEGELWPAAQEDSAEWIGPAIFVASSLLTQNPSLVDIALGVVANYVTEYFRGTPADQRQAKLDLVIETSDGDSRRLKYRGPPENIPDLAKLARELTD